ADPLAGTERGLTAPFLLFGRHGRLPRKNKGVPGGVRLLPRLRKSSNSDSHVNHRQTIVGGPRTSCPRAGDYFALRFWSKSNYSSTTGGGLWRRKAARRRARS